MVSTIIRTLLKSTGRKLSLSSTSSSKSSSAQDIIENIRDDNVEDEMYIRLRQEAKVRVCVVLSCDFVRMSLCVHMKSPNFHFI